MHHSVDTLRERRNEADFPEGGGQRRAELARAREYKEACFKAHKASEYREAFLQDWATKAHHRARFKRGVLCNIKRDFVEEVSVVATIMKEAYLEPKTVSDLGASAAQGKARVCDELWGDTTKVRHTLFNGGWLQNMQAVCQTQYKRAMGSKSEDIHVLWSCLAVVATKKAELERKRVDACKAAYDAAVEDWDAVRQG